LVAFSHTILCHLKKGIFKLKQVAMVLSRKSYQLVLRVVFSYDRMRKMEPTHGEGCVFNERPKRSDASVSPVLQTLQPIKTSALLLSTPKRAALRDQIVALSGLNTPRYKSLGAPLLEQLTHYIQHLPETANSHYAVDGGMLDYLLNRTQAALELVREYIITETDAELSEMQKLWIYALFSASLLQGIGRLQTDYHISLFDKTGTVKTDYQPLLGPMNHTAHYYDYQFIKIDATTRALRQRLTLLLVKNIMPISGFNWIAAHPDVLTVWLALLSEDATGAGTLGALLIRADGIALQRYVDEWRIKAAQHAPEKRPAGRF
jgi:integrating conjugative element relaxase (TIGR03760 family)